MTVIDRDESDMDPVDRSWWSWAGALGGYVASRLIRQTLDVVPGFPARAVHVSYLTPVTDGPLQAQVTVERRGKSSLFAASRLLHAGQPAVLASSFFGASGDGPVYQAGRPPQVPPPQSCPDAGIPQDFVPYIQHMEIRMAGAARPMAGGDEARLTGWARLDGTARAPAEAALILLDAMPPALYAVSTVPAAIPSAEMAVHFSDDLPLLDGTGWALVEIVTEQAGAGWAIDASRLWHSDGTFLATARQTRRVLPIPG